MCVMCGFLKKLKIVLNVIEHKVQYIQFICSARQGTGFYLSYP